MVEKRLMIGKRLRAGHAILPPSSGVPGGVSYITASLLLRFILFEHTVIVRLSRTEGLFTKFELDTFTALHYSHFNLISHLTTALTAGVVKGDT